MNKLKCALVLGILLILSGCKMAILDPKGVIAASEKHLLIDATLLMLIVVIPVIILSFLFTWRYRRKNSKAQYTPNWSHSTTLEIVWWAIPCIIIGILATMTWISTHKLDPYRPLDVKKKPIVIEAVALNWKWLFIYPEQHIASLNYIQIPTQVPIRFLVTADAPMNSLEMPQLAGQIYAMPGMRTKLNWMANEAGTYTGLSTNFSGDGFSGMHFVIRATSRKQFNHWVQSVKQTQNPLTLAKYKQVEKPSENVKPQYFSSVSHHLFQNIIMKYTKPHTTAHAKQ